MSEAPHSPPPRVFRNRSYRSLFAAAAISNYGSMLHAMALPFVAISVLDATPADIATLTAAGLAPGFVLGLVASAWVDRLPRRPILVASDWARAAILLWIPVAAWLELLTLGQLHVVVAIHGFLTFLFGAAHHAILPAIVPSTQLLEANGRLKAVESVTEGGAFASGGFLIQWLGAPFVFIVDAASYVLSALCLRGVDAQEVPRTASVGTSTSVWQETREGVAFLVGHRLLLPGVLGLALVAMSWRVASVVYVLYVYEELGFAPGVLGLVFAAGGVSSLIGAFAAERLPRRVGLGWSMILGVLGVSLATLLLPLAPGAGWLGLLVLVAHQLGDGFEVVFEVNESSLRQSLTPPQLRGRVAGVTGFGGAAAMLFGLVVGGILGEWAGLRETLVVAGGIGLAGATLLVLSPLRTLRSLPSA